MAAKFAEFRTYIAMYDKFKHTYAALAIVQSAFRDKKSDAECRDVMLSQAAKCVQSLEMATELHPILVQLLPKPIEQKADVASDDASDA